MNEKSSNWERAKEKEMKRGLDEGRRRETERKGE